MTQAAILSEKVGNMEMLTEMLDEVEEHRLDYIKTDKRSFLWAASDAMDLAKDFKQDHFSASDPLWSLLSRAVREQERKVNTEMRSAR